MGQIVCVIALKISLLSTSFLDGDRHSVENEERENGKRKRKREIGVKGVEM